jgi:AcrR family transcriptional regulator
MSGIKNLPSCKAEDGAPRKNAAERVFESARDLFYHRGIRAVGVDEIVAHAGVTKPSLYRAFPSKDDLVAACVKQSANEIAAALDEVLAATPDDPRQQLRGIVDLFATRISGADYRGCVMSNMAVEFPDSRHPARPLLEKCKSGLRERILEVARRLPARDPGALADSLVLVIEGAMTSHHIFGCQGPSARMRDTADALIDAYSR